MKRKLFLLPLITTLVFFQFSCRDAPVPGAEHEIGSEFEPEPIAEPEPAAEPEPMVEPEPAAEPEPVAEPEPAAEPEPVAEPVVEPKPEPVAEPEPMVEPQPVAEPEPTAEPEPVVEPEPEPVAEPEPVVEPEPEPVAEPEPAAEPEPVVEPEPEPTAEPEPAVKQAVVPETPIVLGVSFEPEYFSPDGDGENDILSIILTVESGEAASWSFDILQPDLVNAQSRARVFKHFEGVGAPTEAIPWDGRSDPDSATGRSARVMSATDYPYIFTVIDAQGVVSGSMNGVIHVDVLVIREDDGRLRIQIPAIVFRTNAEDFKDLPERTVANNERVIHRLAFILNKFPTYKVRVEGHANPESAPGTKARANEDKKERASNSVSEKRAKAIVDMLVKDGVAKDRLTAVGMGISTPIAEFEDTDNWWKNRRAEFYLEKK